MQCPKCGQELQTHTVASVQVEECPACKGLWFDQDELRKAKDETNADLAWMDVDLWKDPEQFQSARGALKCPKCEGELFSIRYGTTDIVVDCCAQCRGIWLDANEFEGIVAHLTQELTATSASEYVQASLDEAKELLGGTEGFLSEWRDFATVLRMLKYRFYAEHPKLLEGLLTLQEYSPFH